MIFNNSGDVMFKGHDRKWFNFSNQGEECAEIRIHDEISWWGITAEAFLRELDNVSAPNILLRVNTPGGIIDDSIAILNGLRNHKARVVTQNDSLAASCGSFLMLAGDESTAFSNTQVMIHNPMTIAFGDSRNMDKASEILTNYKNIIIQEYVASATKNGVDITADEFSRLMDEETWLTASAAVEYGLIDRIIDAEPDAENKVEPINLSSYAFRNVANTITQRKPSEPKPNNVVNIVGQALNSEARSRQLWLLENSGQ